MCVCVTWTRAARSAELLQGRTRSRACVCVRARVRGRLTSDNVSKVRKTAPSFCCVTSITSLPSAGRGSQAARGLWLATLPVSVSLPHEHTGNRPGLSPISSSSETPLTVSSDNLGANVCISAASCGKSSQGRGRCVRVALGCAGLNSAVIHAGRPLGSSPAAGCSVMVRLVSCGRYGVTLGHNCSWLSWKTR